MSDPGLLGGKVALVTGATTPLGTAVAAGFRGAGAIVEQDDALDLTSPAAIEAAVDRVVATHGQLVVLACCAEAPPAEAVPFHLADEADWQRTFDLDLRASFLCCRAVLPHFLERGAGVIVLSASTASYRAEVGAAYDASKAAILALSRTVAIQYAAQGVRCNAVAAPPAGHGTDVAAVAPAYVFLASDEASYVTGSVYVVDG